MLSKSQVKYIQSLGHKKFRDETNLFIAEGPKSVQDLLAEVPQHIVTVYAVEKWINENIKLKSSAEFVKIDENELGRISQLPAPNQVIAVVKKFNYGNLSAKGEITLALDTIQDPGNLGTIIRIADWFGISQIICSRDCADLYNSKVVQATMGSISRVNVFYSDLPVWLKGQLGVRIYATMLEGKDVTKMDTIKEGLIIIGNESTGIDQEVLPYSNEKISIPRKGGAESLNVAVATGIILSHLV